MIVFLSIIGTLLMIASSFTGFLSVLGNSPEKLVLSCVVFLCGLSSIITAILI